MYPSKKMLEFQKAFQAWKLQNEYQLGVIRNHLTNEFAKADEKKMMFERIFYFKKEDIYFKNGKIRRLDITNRIKYLDDFICKALEVDDHFIRKGSEELVLAENTNVSLTITVLN